MTSKKIYIYLFGVVFLTACQERLASVAENAIPPTIITEPTPNDTDDPAIWLHPTDLAQSKIIGTDKDKNGGLYVYDLSGRIINSATGLKRPNNVDIAYGFDLNGKKTDIAVFTERNAHTIRVFSVPDLKPLDGGGIPVFEEETKKEHRQGMGIALYTHKKDSLTSEIHAIVGRKSGVSGAYLWQYRLEATPEGIVTAKVIRKFGTYSGKKEIEAIAVDNELGYVYYSDETAGVRKYYADPAKGNDELAFFAQEDATHDHEGIAIYKKDEKTGYILVSNQQNNSFLVYNREGSANNPNEHKLLVDIPVSTIECDGADVTNVRLGSQFPNGMLVAMSNGKTFHFYDWRKFQEWIDKGK